MPKISAASIGEHRELRRGQLISAAMELALTQGAQAVTVSAVAAKAGLARTSIYEYFASSADLVADLVIEELGTYAHRLSDAIKDVDDPYEKIERWIAEGLRYVADGRHMLVKSLNTVTPPAYRKEEISMGHRRDYKKRAISFGARIYPDGDGRGYCSPIPAKLAGSHGGGYLGCSCLFLPHGQSNSSIPILDGYW